MEEQEKTPSSEMPPSGVRPESGQTSRQKPSLGRIVLYRHDLYQDNNGCSPAIITAVHPEGSVDLTVFFKGQAPYAFSFVVEGPEEGQYMWPPRT